MTAVDYAIVDKASLLPSYLVACFHCHEHFIASAAAWCRCELRLATLVCPHCSGCFCRASESYKRRFWSEAPRSLRENSRRFRVEDRPGLNASPAALGTKSQQPWVLIVDDEEHMRSLVACYVEQMGYDVTTVSNAEEALAILETMAFDVVITDALMPRMDGREMCRRLKTTYGDRIKLVLMTSLYTASHFKTEALHQFGVDEYLTKPLRFADLQTALDRLAPLPESSF